jgi:hypothetical protein
MSLELRPFEPKNIKAYFTAASMIKIESIIAMIPVVNVIKIFFVTHTREYAKVLVPNTFWGVI